MVIIKIYITEHEKFQIFFQIAQKLKEFGYQIIFFLPDYITFNYNFKNLIFLPIENFEETLKYFTNHILITDDKIFQKNYQQKFSQVIYYQNENFEQLLNYLNPLFPKNVNIISPITKNFKIKNLYKVSWYVTKNELYADPTENPSYRILVHNQNEYFKEAGIHSRIYSEVSEEFFTSDFVIFVRFGKEELELIKHLQERGVNVIFLHDENLWGFEYLHETWEEVDAIACTSKKLIEATKSRINRKDHFFLNDRNCDDLTKTYYHSYHRENPVVGWCGLSGARLIRGVIKPLMERNSLQLEILSDKHELRKDLTTIIWDKNTYISHINQFDIFVAPQDHVQMFAKSHVKISIPAILGIPIVASPLDSYTKIIEHGKSGFFCETIEDWERYCIMLKDKDLRMEIGLNGRKNFLSYYGNHKATENWIQLFKDLKG